MSNSASRLWLVIPAAGIGSRMQAALPKQYLKLNGRSVIEHTLACFAGLEGLAAAVVVISSADRHWPDLTIDCGYPLHTASGGGERADSVLNGLNRLVQLGAADSDWVLVHDAARPCLGAHDLHKLVDICMEHNSGGILATPVRDTMKRDNEHGSISHTENRQGLWHALTPQMFRLGELSQALQAALASGQIQVTDEASAMEAAGYQTLLVEGDASNIKITRPADLALAEFFLSRGLSQ